MTWQIITPEYPPQPGGVSHYVYSLAGALNQAGDEVHVWAPAAQGPAPVIPGVRVHHELGSISIRDLMRTGQALNRFPQPRRIFVQWVPHGYRYRSMNVFFCFWIWMRSLLRGDTVELMVHEAFLELRQRKLRHSAAALVHRIMMILLLQSTRRVWTSIPRIGPLCRPYALGRDVTFNWLPIPSSIPVTATALEGSHVRRTYVNGGKWLIGHFGTYGAPIAAALRAVAPPLLANCESASLLLIGQGSHEFRNQMLEEFPELASRIESSGQLDSFQDLSAHISACDLMIQPYPDGVSTRRTTVMAGLAHGRPVVTTSGPSTEEFWKDSGALTLVPIKDDRAFVDAASALLEDEEARARLGATAAMLYRTRLDISQTITRLRGPVQEPELVAS